MIGLAWAATAIAKENLMKKLTVACCLAVLLNAGHALAVGPAPDVLVKTTVQDVMTTLKNDQNVTTSEAIRLVEAKVFPHFDFPRITQQVLGKNWNAATAEQQQKLVQEFQKMLVRTYVKQLINNRNSQVDVRPPLMADSGKEASVSTDVNNAQTGQKVNISYSFADTTNGWKVKNVTVDGVSLLTSYRNSFNDAVKQGGIDGLIQKMVNKNARAVQQ